VLDFLLNFVGTPICTDIGASLRYAPAEVIDTLEKLSGAFADFKNYGRAFQPRF